MAAPPEDLDDSDYVFKDALIPWMRAGMFLVALGVGLYFGARPAYRMYKENKASVRVEQVERALASNDPAALAGVAEDLRLALALAPASPRVWRAAGLFCAATGSDEGFHYWTLLEGDPGFTDEDRLALAEYAHRKGRLDLVVRHMTTLLANGCDEVRFWRLAVEHLRAREEHPRAAEAARRWIQKTPADEEAQFALGLTLVSLSKPEERAEGKGLLWGLALGSGPWAGRAVGALVRHPDLNRGELETLHRTAERLGAGPVLLTGLRLRLEPAREAEILDGLVRSAGGTNQVHRREAVAFLADRNDLARALALMPPDVAAGDPRLRTARLQALLDMGRTEDAAAEIGGATLAAGVEPHFRHCLDAQLKLRSGSRDQAATLLGQAIAACGGNPAALKFVAIYSERLGFPIQAIAAHQKLGEHMEFTVPAARQILRLALAANRIGDARTALRRASRFLPEDPALLLGSAYLDLLADPPLAPERMEEVRRIVELRPGDAFARGTLALAQWKSGDLATALATLDGEGVDWSKAEGRVQAVRAAILGANLQREAARQIARGIDLGRLLTEERLLIEEWL